VAKLNILGPLPLFLGVWMLADSGSARIPRRTQLFAVGVFCAAAGAASLCWSQLIDWQRFFAVWRGLGRPAPSPMRGAAVLLCESGFLALGVAGWVGCLRRGRERSRVVWVSAYAGLALLPFAYRLATRGGFLPFHYLFVSLGVLAVFFGDASLRLLRRLSLPTAGARGALVALAFAVSLHAVSLFAALDSRRRDAARYAPNRPVYEQIARLRPGLQLGLVVGARAPRPKAGLRALHAIGLPGSRLREAFEALFQPLPAASLAPGAERLRVPALGAEIVLPRGPQGASPR
jgi:hypothetical protein